MSPRRYVGRKVLQALATLVFVLTVNFLLFRILPGDPVSILARSQRLTEQDIVELQRELGLDQPLAQQYVTYMGQMVTGNLGVSLLTGDEVSSIVASRVWPTFLLVGLGTLFATLIGVWIGVKGAWRRGRAFDRSSLLTSLALYSTPEGWLGMLFLLVFSGILGWFPAGGYATQGLEGFARIADIAEHLFLPVLTLTLGYVGEYAIVMRSSMLDVLHEDFVTSARAKGVPEPEIRRRHVVPNAFLPTFTLIFLNIGFVLGGAVVIEVVFSWPGLGRLAYDAIERVDYPVIQGVFLIASFSVIVFNLVADIAYGFLDPRVRGA
jgi:peptide/nickel transport system permease protein